MSPEHPATAPDPRELLRAHISSLEEKVERLSNELAEVNAELKQYRTALGALTGKPSQVKKTVTRLVVRGEVVAVLKETPEHSSTRKALDTAVRERLKAAGYKLNGISRRMDEALQEETFLLERNKVTLAERPS